MNSEKQIVTKIVVGAVILNEEGKLLILQRGNDEDVYPNLWELPSGKRESFESPLETMKREVKEETGLEVYEIALLSPFDYKIEKLDKISDCVQINYLARPLKDAQVRLSSEHQAVAWITEEELPKFGVSEETGHIILEAFNLARRLDLVRK